MQLTLSKCECPYMQHPYVRTFQSSLVLVVLLLLTGSLSVFGNSRGYITVLCSSPCALGEILDYAPSTPTYHHPSARLTFINPTKHCRIPLLLANHRPPARASCCSRSPLPI